MMGEGQNQPQIAQKRTMSQEVAEKEEEDRIGTLPDCLLLEVLSRLPSTEHAIRTSTPSKRWVHLWTLVPTLFFSYSDLPVLQSLENPSSYALLVDKTLAQCRQSKLKRFQVFVQYDIQYESQYKNWIRFAINRNVEELWLDFRYDRRREAECRLDESLLINSHLTDLRLVGCMLNSSSAISLKSLKSLCISNQNLDEEWIVNILSGSPLLETLLFEYCCHYESESDTESYSESDSEFDSEAESEAEAEAEADIININAPNTNSLLLTQCPQLNLKKFKVYTWFHIRFESQLNSWIRYAVRCNVQEFNLTFWSTDFKYEFNLDQIVFTSSCFTKMELKGCMLNPVGAISWKNLRSLRISCQSLNDDLISNILSGSPVLEYLELDECYGYKRLDITSKSVKNLVISGYRNHREKSEIDTIEVDAPNILSLTIQGNICLWKFLLVNVKCLVKAELNYWCAKMDRHKTRKERKEEILEGYIMSLGHVEELQIGSDCSLAVLNLQAQGFAFPSNVKFHNSISFLKEYLGWWK